MVLIPFDPADVQFDIEDRWKWWDSMRSWFSERGYTLYDYVVNGDNERHYTHWRPTKLCPGPVSFPYPHMGSDNDPVGYSNNYGEGRVVFAQDNEGCHLAIKLVKGGSEELDVLGHLKNEADLRDAKSFPCVLPILDLLPCECHWFAIMPRWGEVTLEPWFPTLYHAVKFIQSLLKGLIFLHSRRIFHRDVGQRNILVNRLTGFKKTSVAYKMHFELEEDGKLLYALFDFDRAIMLDVETYGENPMLPICLVDRGFFVPPYERLLGYPDFDPFKYDVACLGIYFDRIFASYILDAPLLAPLIDGMLTADIHKRFSAAQALSFTENILGTVSQSTLSFKKSPTWTGNYYEHDRWKDLPEDFVATWASYRDHSLSRFTRFQIWFMFTGRSPAWYILHTCRCMHRAVSSFVEALAAMFFSKLR